MSAVTPLIGKVIAEFIDDFISGPVGPLFCGTLSLTSTDLSGTQSTVITTNGNNTNNVVATNVAASANNNTVSASSQSFTSSIAEVHLESYFQSQTGNGNFGIGFSDVDPFVSFTNLVIALQAVPSGGLLIDGISGIPVATGVTMTPGAYELAVNLDSTGSASFADSEGNSGALTIMAGYTNASPVYLLCVCNSGDVLNDTITIDVNAGEAAFTLPTVGAIPWCEV